jgi:glycosyltransferase involved in cell wall biosynthesis
MSDDLPTVSVVFISYNRAHTLVATYEAFLAFTDYPRDKLELILCDDGSDAFNRRIIDRLDFDRRLIAKTSAGLGANCNKGIAAAHGEFVLQLQDDFMLTRRGDYLRKAIEVLQRMPDVGMILFRDRPELPDSEQRELDDLRVIILKDRVNEKGKLTNGAYSDNPHLKRRDFHDVVGGYEAGVSMIKMELHMMKQVCRQSTYRVATIVGMEVFKHIGERFSFNPGKRRARMLKRFQRLPGGTALYRLVRHLKRSFRPED